MAKAQNSKRMFVELVVSAALLSSPSQADVEHVGWAPGISRQSAVGSRQPVGWVLAAIGFQSLFPAGLLAQSDSGGPESVDPPTREALRLSLYLLAILIVFLFGIAAIIIGVRRWRESLDVPRRKPTDTTDVWLMHKVPDIEPDLPEASPEDGAEGGLPEGLGDEDGVEGQDEGEDGDDLK